MNIRVSGLPASSAIVPTAVCAALILSFAACSDKQTQFIDTADAASSSGNPGGNGEAGVDPESDGGDVNDGGPVTAVRETVASGIVFIQGDYAQGEFSNVGNVVRTSDASCVAFVRPAASALVSVGTLALTGGLVAQPGGPPISPLIIPSPADNRYAYTTTLSERLFSNGTAQAITLTRSGTGALAPFAAAPTLSTPVNTVLMITRDSVSLSPNTPFRVAWTTSGDAGVGAPFLHVTFEYLATSIDAGASKTASILCSFPAAGGIGEIGSAFLTAVSEDLGGPASGGIFAVHAGDRFVDRTGGGFFVARTMTASIASASANVSLR